MTVPKKPKNQIYHLISPAIPSLQGYEGEKVFAVRSGDQIRPEFHIDTVGDSKVLNAKRGSYILRVE